MRTSTAVSLQDGQSACHTTPPTTKGESVPHLPLLAGLLTYLTVGGGGRGLPFRGASPPTSGTSCSRPGEFRSCVRSQAQCPEAEPFQWPGATWQFSTRVGQGADRARSFVTSGVCPTGRIHRAYTPTRITAPGACWVLAGCPGHRAKCAPCICPRALSTSEERTAMAHILQMKSRVSEGRNYLFKVTQRVRGSLGLGPGCL